MNSNYPWFCQEKARLCPFPQWSSDVESAASSCSGARARLFQVTPQLTLLLHILGQVLPLSNACPGTGMGGMYKSRAGP